MSIYFNTITRSLFILVIISVSIHPLFSQTSVNTISQLRALSPGASSQVAVLGYYEPGDWGNQRIYNWAGTSTVPDNEGTVIQPNSGGNGRWIMVVTENYYDVKWFGAAPEHYGENARMDNQFPILSCINAVMSTTHKTVLISNGIYITTGVIRLTGSQYNGLRLRGVPWSTNNGITTFGDIYDISNSDNWTKPNYNAPISVIKRSNGETDYRHIIQIGTTDQTELTNDILIEDIVIHGNKQGSPSSDGHGLLLNYYDKVGNLGVIIRNVAVDSNRASGFSFFAAGILADNILYCDGGDIMGQHGIQGFGSSFDHEPAVIKNVESWGRGRGMGIDFASGSQFILDHFFVHNNQYGMKTAGEHVEIYNGTFQNNNPPPGFYGFSSRQRVEGTKHDIFIMDNVVLKDNVFLMYRGEYPNGKKFGNVQLTGKYMAGISHSRFWKFEIEGVDGALNSVPAAIRTAEMAAATPHAPDDVGVTFHNLIVKNNNAEGVRADGAPITRIKSGRIYNNTDVGYFQRGIDGVSILANIEIFGNSEPFATNNGIIKYTNIVDGQGNPIIPPGNAIRLPESNIITASVNGTSNVTLTFEGTTTQPGRNISSVRLYQYVPGSENPLNNLSDIHLGTFSGPGPHEHTVTGLQEGTLYRFYTIAVDNAGDEGIEPLDFDGNMQGFTVEIHNIPLQSGWNKI